MISTSEKRTISLENNNSILDASFSSYLNDSQDTFMRKHAQSSHTQNLVVPISPHSAYTAKKNVKDGEIGIFGAEKYFTGAIGEDISVIPNKGSNPSSNSGKEREEKEEEVVPDKLIVKNKAQSATLSVRSEASWNSRSELLQSNPRRKEMNKVSNLKSFFAVFGCNCNGKSSVEIKEEIREDRAVLGREITNKDMKAGDLVVRTTKSLSTRWEEEEIQIKKLDPNSKREDCFSFPVVNPKAGDQEVIRNSPEVFGSPIMEKAKKSLTLERKLTMLNWDGVTPRGSDIEIPYNDSESDASSDLFEIESFSTNRNSFPGRHTLDGMLRPSNGGYAPSEASIDWSVATESAADVSVISAYQEIRNGTAKNSSGIAWNMKADKEVVQKKAPGILPGCKSLNSVRVAGDEYRTMGGHRAEIGGSPRRQLRLDSATPIIKIQAEAKLTGFDSRSRVQNGFGARPPLSSHTSHTSSHLLYIQ